MTLAVATDDGQALYAAAAELLERAAMPGRGARLTGVSGQELEEPARQMDLFGEAPSHRSKLNATLDEISRRFGSRAVVPADQAGCGAAEGLDDQAEEVRRQAGASRLDLTRPRRPS